MPRQLRPSLQVILTEMRVGMKTVRCMQTIVSTTRPSRPARPAPPSSPAAPEPKESKGWGETLVLGALFGAWYLANM